MSNRTNFAAKFRALFIVFLAVVGSAKATDGLEARRISQNANNIARMDEAMRPKVRAVISDMERNGYKPIIDNAVYRTPAQQFALYRKGYSKVTYSYHNATSKDGKPDSLAADITDQRWGWTGLAPRSYWLTQARVAWCHNLYPGSFFGLSTAQKNSYRAALSSKAFDAYKGPLGWDPAHIEPRGITTAQAKAGKRPYSK